MILYVVYIYILKYENYKINHSESCNQKGHKLGIEFTHNLAFIQIYKYYYNYQEVGRNIIDTITLDYLPEI